MTDPTSTTDKTSTSDTTRATERVTITPAAATKLGELQARHGPLLFHQSGLL